MDKCECCGFSTARHLVHTKEGHCYCIGHYLVHLFNDDVEELSRPSIKKN